jgi:hypothetical protein
MWRPGILLALAALAGFSSIGSQAADEPLDVFTEPPRLFLRPQRLKLLRRERERQSMRWEHLQTLIAGRAVMAEPGFSSALYYQVAQDAASARRAVEWALANPADLRQLALVFDWCRDVMTPQQTAALAARLARGIAETERQMALPQMRSRVLAAIALSDSAPEAARKTLEQVVHGWWSRLAVPAIKSGRDPVPREHAYAFFELLHAIRDNTNADLRDAAPKYFQRLPASRILSYYPATYPAPEGDYRIIARRGGGEPNTRDAALARAAELAMVAFDTNAPDNQTLQGWLMHDQFILRSTFGAPYEFLWANPYQPGLSYFHLPLVFHDDTMGRLFVRSDWEETATWLGYFDGDFQLFQNGKITVLNPQLTEGPLALTSALVYFGRNARDFESVRKEDEHIFILGLKPRTRYDLEVDDQELAERETDPGGVLELQTPANVKTGVRMREAGANEIQSHP